jgi:type IV pilus assembly protein PilF
MKTNIFFLSIILLLVSCGGKKTGETNSAQRIQEYKSLAIASIYRRNFQQALQDIQKIESLDSNDPELYLIKGLIYFGLRDYDSAEASYKKALEIKSDYSEARYNLCGLYLKLDKLDSAIEQCKKASADVLYRSRDKALTSLGVAYYKKGDVQKAKEYYDKSLEINPALVYTHNELGKLYMSAGDYQRALEEFKRATTGYELYDEALFNLGVCYLKLGKTVEACESFKRVVKISSLSEYGMNASKYINSICN